MKKRLGLIFASIIFITVLVLALLSPGEVTIKLANYPHFTINLYIFVALLVGVILVVGKAIKLFAMLLKLPAYLSRWYHRRNIKNNNQTFHEGLHLYLQGDYAQASSLLIKVAQSPNLQVIAGLFAADAALANNDTKTARKAIILSGLSPSKDAAADIIAADIAIGDETPENASFRINDIIDKKTNNLRAIRMLIKLCEKTNTWHLAKPALEHLDKALHHTPYRQQQIRIQITDALLKQASEQKDKRQLHEIWRQASEQTQKELLESYIPLMVQLGDIKEAERYLEKMIEQDRNEYAIQQYSLLSDISVEHRIKRTEKWLAQQPNNPELLLCLARLYKINAQSDKAKEYLQKSLAVKPTYQAWSELNKPS